jgi:hypothetical protein
MPKDSFNSPLHSLIIRGTIALRDIGTGLDALSSVAMAKTPTKIEVTQEGDERFLLMTFADGSEERKPIVKLPKKPPRFTHRKVTFDKSTKKGF